MNKSEIYAVLRKKYLTEDATGETLEAFSDIFHTACKTIELFETYRLIISVFGKAYKLTDKFDIRRKKMYT